MTPYARFFKSDLQMQTPIDRAHWRGKKALPADPTEDDLKLAADAYIARCYEVGLEIIGITDHNLAGRGVFIDHLRRAIDRAAPHRGYRITLFPGFEIAGPIGKGAHMLCLFPPATTIDALDHLLTRFGLHPDGRFGKGGAPTPVSAESCTFDSLLRIVQQEHNGLAVLAHTTGSSGALDHRTVAGFWSREVIGNDALLAMELAKPPSQWLSESPGSLVTSVILNRDTRYQRRHPIAVVMSSDCKALEPFQDGNPNYIGGRHTWLKMSEPSIEGLRQAFLDHDSRIAFGDARPEDLYSHPRIRSISIKGAQFLADQSLDFPATMTTLIGGAGSGKSTILEYLRVVLGQTKAIRGDEVRRSFELLQPTITSTTSIEAVIERDGTTWTLTSRAGGPPAVTSGEPIPDVTQFFPVQMFSQKEIYAVARDDTARAELLDSFIRDELDGLRRQAEDIRRDLRQLDQRLEGESALSDRVKELQTERLSLQKKIESLQRFEDPVRTWRTRVAEESFLTGMSEEVRSVAAAILEPVEDLELTTTAVPSLVQTGEHAKLMQEVATAADQAAQQLRAAVISAVKAFVTAHDQRVAVADVAAWQASVVQAKELYQRLRAEVAQHDADPNQLLTYEQTLQSVEGQLKVTNEELEGLVEIRTRRQLRLDALRTVWQKETDCRARKAAALQEKVPLTDDSDVPFITIDVRPCADHAAVLATMEPYRRDGRSVSSQDWSELIEHAINVTKDGDSPLVTIAEWAARIEAGEQIDGLPLRPDKQPKLAEWIDAPARRTLEETRVPDGVVIMLNRADGSSAGEMAQLSVGQKSTAILALVLADGDAPIIIDQPEDDLDNEFTYRELVPLLRRVKTTRQVILATHDPNLPVNGDAELIYALAARDGRGKVKEVNNTPAVGALDRAAVRIAVEDIMEGSEEAFRRRHDKYGF